MIYKIRDPISSLTHCFGALLSTAGLVFLVSEAAYSAKPLHIVTFSIFGAGLVLLYTFSTLYHWLPFSEKTTPFLRKADHIMIFILIAATYTPVCLILLRGGWGWSIFGSIWGLALIGIILKIFWMEAPRWFSVSLYIIMGWVAIIAIWPLIQRLHIGGLMWLFAGGFFYTAGAIIYAVKKPNFLQNILGFHEIFHIFVLLGSFSHFWVMHKYLMMYN